MFRRMLLFAACTTFHFLLLLQTCTSVSEDLCPPSSCGNIRNISYPFRLETDPKNCGDHRYTLSCENNATTVLHLYSGKYHVQGIDYDNFTIRVADAGVNGDNCSTIPLYPLAKDNFSSGDPYTWYKYKWVDTEFKPELSKTMVFVSCANPANSTEYADATACNANRKQEHNSYVYGDGGMEAGKLMNMCSIETIAMLGAAKNYKNMTFPEIHKELAYGFELSWHNVNCKYCRTCYTDERNKSICLDGSYRTICYFRGGIRCSYVPDKYALDFQIKALLYGVFIALGMLCYLVKTLCGTPLVFAFLIYKWRRRHLSGYNTIEEFLQSHNNLMPMRYPYSDIKKMTAGFKQKLGEGGFGSVYKGKLRSGRAAAVKMLSKSTTNGQDFINEVATIGRVYHSNIVQLIGFCVEGSKHALIYEFMSSGSLDNFLVPSEGSISFSWEKLYEISLGVARGIKYLHQDCDMQILHFDIKPHNILLDENFVPKISDFGLAKLYATNVSIKSLTAARGTIGYMAPELFYRNIGSISCKADVYSFGMLLLEMAGKRKKLNALIENPSESYFPVWVYDEEISREKVGAKGDVMDEESNEIGKKMVIVGLWCIQMNPNNRPPMNKVIEMLEGDLGDLELPPRPFQYPREEVVMSEGESPSTLTNFSESNSLIRNGLVENS